MMAEVSEKRRSSPTRVARGRHRSTSSVALASCLWLAACGGAANGPEEAVREWVRQGHAAVEDRDRRTLVAMISPAYADGRGNSREDIGNMLRLYFLRSQKVALITKIEELEIIGDSAAELVLSVGMAGSDDNVLGFSADVYRFEMELERDDETWRLIAARWGGFGDELY